MAGNSSAAPLSCVSKEEADTFVQFPITLSGVLSVTQQVRPSVVVFGDVPTPPLSRSLIIQYLGIPKSVREITKKCETNSRRCWPSACHSYFHKDKGVLRIWRTAFITGDHRRHAIWSRRRR